MATISTSEKGHAKVTANFSRLITIAKRNSKVYKPANAKLKIPALETANAQGEQLVNNVSPNEKVYSVSVGKRHVVFDTIETNATGAYSSLDSLDGVDENLKKKAFTSLKKLKGTNKAASTTTAAASVAADPSGAAAPSRKKHSVSQQSFDMKLKNFREFIDVLKLIPEYDPEEDELKIASLVALLDSATSINKKVDYDYSPYATALNLRDVFLYFKETGLVDLSKKLKSYIKSVKDISATDKEEAKGIPFSKPAARDLFF